MEPLWFAILSFMLTAYVVLDGFDLGAGILHLFAARDDRERRTILNAIGPVWDGNEVWLIAAGGVLYFAFPQVYASGFSGFYLPLMIVLWLLMLRALGIEFRHRVGHPLWKSFWDAVFALGSTLLVVFFGAALGNVVRGVPLDSSGHFFAPLWTTFTVVPEAGILDWFTLLMGVVAVCTLTTHGALYVILKTEGRIRERARRVVPWSWIATVVTSLAALESVTVIRPELWNNYSSAPWAWAFPLTGLLAAAAIPLFHRRGRELRAFLASAFFIAGMMGATAFGLYPNLLPASTDPAFSLTAAKTITHGYALEIGIIWWSIGMTLAVAYFIIVYRLHRGKVALPPDGSGY